MSYAAIETQNRQLLLDETCGDFLCLRLYAGRSLPECDKIGCLCDGDGDSDECEYVDVVYPDPSILALEFYDRAETSIWVNLPVAIENETRRFIAALRFADHGLEVTP